MSFDEFWRLLRQHDWFYQMSESRAVYGRGRDQSSVLSAAMADNELFTEAYHSWFDYKFANGPEPVKGSRKALRFWL